MHHMTHMDKNMKDCIETCNECRDECEATLYQHCLEMGEDHAAFKLFDRAWDDPLALVRRTDGHIRSDHARRVSRV